MQIILATIDFLKKANIECLDDLATHLVGVDTIIYSGHFYHTDRHSDLIKLFTDSQATCLILESIVVYSNKFKDILNELIKNQDAGTFNQAIMEFGALQCTPRNPDCNNCILKKKCFALDSIV